MERGEEGERAEVEEEQADDGRGEPLHPQLRRRPPRDVQGTPEFDTITDLINHRFVKMKTVPGDGNELNINSRFGAV